MEKIAAASQDDTELFPRVACTFHRWMVDSASTTDASALDYVRKLKVLFQDDSKSFHGMASEEYYGLVKSSPANVRCNGTRSCCVRKFIDFWKARGGKMWKEGRGWRRVPPSAQQRSSRGLPSVYALKPRSGAQPEPDNDQVASEGVAQEMRSTHELVVDGAPREVEGPRPRAVQPAAAGRLARGLMRRRPAAPDPEAARGTKRRNAQAGGSLDAKARRQRGEIDLRLEGDAPALDADTERAEGNSEPLTCLVSSSSDEVREVTMQGAPPPACPANCGLKRRHRWKSSCKLGQERPALSGPAAAAAATDAEQPDENQLPEQHGGEEQPDIEQRDWALADRHRAPDPRSALDPPAVDSDTEHAEGDPELAPRVLIVQHSGNPSVDGRYLRYRRCSRGRPCYSRAGGRGMYLYWNGAWCIGAAFGSRDLAQAQVREAGDRGSVPCEPYPAAWRVHRAAPAGPAVGDGELREAARMRVLDGLAAAAEEPPGDGGAAACSTGGGASSSREESDEDSPPSGLVGWSTGGSEPSSGRAASREAGPNFKGLLRDHVLRPPSSPMDVARKLRRMRLCCQDDVAFEKSHLSRMRPHHLSRIEILRVVLDLENEVRGGTDPATDSDQRADEAASPLRRDGRAADGEAAPARFQPPDHRTLQPGPSALRPRRPSGARRFAEARVTYSDGLFCADGRGPELEERVSVASWRSESILWFFQPGARVTCDRCGLHWPQSMGMLAGAPGKSQFAQDQFWCTECATAWWHANVTASGGGGGAEASAAGGAG